MTINKSEFTKLQLQSNVEDGLEAIDNVLRILESAVTEIGRFKATFQSIGSGKDPESLNARTTEEVVLSWIANHLASNILGNVRIDMLVTHAARIAAARASLKAEA